MARVRCSIIVSVLACLVCLPGVASAGGWLVLTLDELPAASRLNAGQEVVLGFVARQHGKEPIGRAGPIARFTHQESGQQVSVTAIDEGPLGHYVVRIHAADRRRVGMVDPRLGDGPPDADAHRRAHAERGIASTHAGAGPRPMAAPGCIGRPGPGRRRLPHRRLARPGGHPATRVGEAGKRGGRGRPSP